MPTWCMSGIPVTQSPFAPSLQLDACHVHPLHSHPLPPLSNLMHVRSTRYTVTLCLLSPTWCMSDTLVTQSHFALHLLHIHSLPYTCCTFTLSLHLLHIHFLPYILYTFTLCLTPVTHSSFALWEWCDCLWWTVMRVVWLFVMDSYESGVTVMDSYESSVTVGQL